MNSLSRALLLILLAATPAAASYITLSGSGVVSGAPGDTVGWGFTIHSTETSDWITITSVTILTENSPLGPGLPPTSAFIDYAGNNGGPPATDYAIPPGGDWTDNFAVGLPFGSGLGAYPIDPGIGTGISDIGTFQVLYSLYSDDPGTDGADVQDNVPLLTQGGSNPSFEIDVQDEVPEPTSAVMIAVGLLLLAIGRRRKSAPNAAKSSLTH